MNKNVIYISIAVLVLLVSSFLWYRQALATKTFSYQDVIYDCQETKEVIVAGTVLRVTPGTNGTIMLAREGQEYKCSISSDAAKKPDVVLGASGEDVKIVLSDNLGNDVEVKAGRVSVGADGNTVVVNESGTSIKLENGGIVEIGANGNVNIDVPGEGSVKVNGGKVDVKTPEGAVKVDGGTVKITTPETGDVNITDQGVSIPSENLDIKY